MTTDLVSLSEFVDGISDYTSQSKNTDRGLKMIYAYNNFLKTPICEEMFTGKNPLFIDFVKCCQSEALKKGIKNSFDNFGEDAFSVTVYRMAGKEYNQKDRMTFVTSYHLKTINDLVGKIDRYREESQWDWMSEFKTENPC